MACLKKILLQSLVQLAAAMRTPPRTHPQQALRLCGQTGRFWRNYVWSSNLWTWHVELSPRRHSLVCPSSNPFSPACSLATLCHDQEIHHLSWRKWRGWWGGTWQAVTTTLLSTGLCVWHVPSTPSSMGWVSWKRRWVIELKRRELTLLNPAFLVTVMPAQFTVFCSLHKCKNIGWVTTAMLRIIWNNG